MCLRMRHSAEASVAHRPPPADSAARRYTAMSRSTFTASSAGSGARSSGRRSTDPVRSTISLPYSGALASIQAIRSPLRISGRRRAGLSQRPSGVARKRVGTLIFMPEWRLNRSEPVVAASISRVTRMPLSPSRNMDRMSACQSSACTSRSVKKESPLTRPTTAQSSNGGEPDILIGSRASALNVSAGLAPGLNLKASWRKYRGGAGSRQSTAAANTTRSRVAARAAAGVPLGMWAPSLLAGWAKCNLSDLTVLPPQPSPACAQAIT
jgi:hypothetical protein